MFYKKEQTVRQRLMFIHCGIQRYCDERQVTAQTHSFHREVMLDISIASL